MFSYFYVLLRTKIYFNRFAFQKIEALEHRMYTHALHKDPRLEELYGLCEKKALVC